MKDVLEITVKKIIGWIKNPPAVGKWILVTPDLAYELLIYCDDTEDGHRKQRPLRPGRVRDIAAAMASGAFRSTIQGIAIDVDGRVQEGQHRLHAIIEYGMPWPMLVHFGQPVELFEYYDIGWKRSPGDIFGIYGVTDASAAAAITRQVNVYHSKGHRGNSTGFPTLNSPGETYDYYLKVGPDDIQKGVKMSRKFKRNKLPNPAVIGGLYVVAHQMTNGEATDFFESIASGDNLGPRSIEKKARDYLLINGKDLTATKVASIVIRAWNAKRAKRRTFSTEPTAEMPELV